MRHGCAVGLLAFANACSSAASAHPAPTVPSSPPLDDGRPSTHAGSGLEHAQALEELKIAPLGWGIDRQHSLRVLLPDAPHWLRVAFWGKKSLVAFRYGKDHHAVVGGFILHVPDAATQGACGDAFEKWAKPWLELFEVDVVHDPPQAADWTGKIVDIDSLVATMATLGMHDSYAGAYAAYPAWPGACLVLGVAVPARGELERARAVRDRFAREVLPKLQITTTVEPKESY
jgi:hypothetical protein